MKAFLGTAVLVGSLAIAPAGAQPRSSAETATVGAKTCEVPPDLLATGDSVLARVADAVSGRKKLDVLVVGSGSSSLASADGNAAAYPARLEASLREKLPGVGVNVTTSIQAKRTAEDALETLKSLGAQRPDLLIWQTGTADAIRSIHVDDFRNALDEGVGTVRAAGADVILVNLQFSPQIETMLHTTPYLESMRAVAQQQDVPLFDRYSIMQNWNETGEFDLSNSSRGFALARAVHDCLGRALADLVIAAARLPPLKSGAAN